MVVAITARQWRSLVAATGIEEYLPVVEKAFGVRLDREGDRYIARDAIGALLAPWFAARTATEAGAEDAPAGGGCGRYQTSPSAPEQHPTGSTPHPPVPHGHQPPPLPHPTPP